MALLDDKTKDMMDFIVDREKCVQCGLCSADCPVLIIDGKTEFPTIREGKEGLCLKCQHCLAICPEGAISIWGKHPGKSLLLEGALPTGADLELLMKGRRSVRKFQKEEIAPELIHQLISVASHAPTAQNINAVHFTVVETRGELQKLRELVYRHLRKAFEEDRIPKSRMVLHKSRELWESKQIDIIFRDAPHLLIASSPEAGSFSRTDATIAVTYFDLLANTRGIGTLWDGFAQWAMEEIAPELKPILGIPEGHRIEMVLLFGRPARKYARSIQNDPSISRLRL